MTTTPLRNGTALAATVGFGYVACTLVFWLWPDAAAAFMNALFHGLNFRKLQIGAAAFDFHGFLYALVPLVAWAFALGALHGWLVGRLHGKVGEKTNERPYPNF